MNTFLLFLLKILRQSLILTLPQTIDLIKSYKKIVCEAIIFNDIYHSIPIFLLLQTLLNCLFILLNDSVFENKFCTSLFLIDFIIKSSYDNNESIYA